MKQKYGSKSNFPCLLVKANNTMIKCKTFKVDTPNSYSLLVNVNGFDTLHVGEKFRYVTVKINQWHEKEGFPFNGTKLMADGDNLNAGSKVKIYLTKKLESFT